MVCTLVKTAMVFDGARSVAALLEMHVTDSDVLTGLLRVPPATDKSGGIALCAYSALKLAAEGSKACNRKVEVRPFLETP